MFEPMIQGVKRICRIAARAVPAGLAEQSAAGVKPRLNVRPVEVCTFGESALEIGTDNRHYGPSQTAELRFRSAEIIPADTPYCFAVECVNGRKLLIGTSEPPYCSVERRQAYTAPAQASTAFEYTVTFAGPIAAAEVDF